MAPSTSYSPWSAFLHVLQVTPRLATEVGRCASVPGRSHPRDLASSHEPFSRALYRAGASPTRPDLGFQCLLLSLSLSLTASRLDSIAEDAPRTRAAARLSFKYRFRFRAQGPEPETLHPSFLWFAQARAAAARTSERRGACFRLPV